MLSVDSSVASLNARPQPYRLQLSALRPLSPSPLWDGEAETGFSTVPSDPLRVTSKPACQLLTPPRQRVVDNHLVGVQAFANAGASLIGGIDRVRFHFEGDTLDVVAPSFRTLSDANGVERTYYGYWAEIAKPQSLNGRAHLFVEAIPADANMQSRVIGPFPYFLRDTLYDLELEIAPSLPKITNERYQNLNSALVACKNAGIEAARITVTEDYNLEGFSKNQTYTHDGSWTTVECAPGVTMTMGSDTLDFENDKAAFRLKHSYLHFKGSGIIHDFRNLNWIRLESGDPYWLDGIEIINSDPDGGRALFAKANWPGYARYSEPCYFTECEVEHVHRPFQSALLVRGGSVDDGCHDVVNGSDIVTGLLVKSWDNTAWWNDPLLSMTVSYNSGAGNGTSASVEQTGNNSGDRTWIFRVDGAVIDDTFVASASAADVAGTNYNVSDLVNHINTVVAAIDPGFSATLIDDTRRAQRLGLQTGKGFSFAEQDVTDTTLSLYVEFDLHSDFYQFSDFQDLENVIISFCEVRNFGGQILFFGGKDITTRSDDVAVINNVFDAIDGVGHLSQAGERTFSHVTIAHNTWNDQVLSIGSDSMWDSFSLIANNVAPGMSGDATAQGSSMTVKNNHVSIDDGRRAFAGRTITGGVGDTIAGTEDTLFVDADGADFTPVGELLANLKDPVWVGPSGSTAPQPAGRIVD